MRADHFRAATVAVVFAPPRTARQIEEPGTCSCLLQRECSFHANRAFARAFGMPVYLNELIGLKADKARRRIGYSDPVFWRSTLS